MHLCDSFWSRGILQAFKQIYPLATFAKRNTYRFNVGLREIFVQFPQMDESKGDADYVDSDPERVQYVVAEGAVHQRATWGIMPRLRVRGEGAT